jgi:hypothetical protein
MDGQQHMTITEAHPYHDGRGCKVFNPNCPLCRNDQAKETAYVGWSLHQATLAAAEARATAAEARCKVLEEALTEIARGVLDNENGGDYIDKAYRLARTTLSRLPAATSHAETMRKVRETLQLVLALRRNERVDLKKYGVKCDADITERVREALALLGKGE